MRSDGYGDEFIDAAARTRRQRQNIPYGEGDPTPPRTRGTPPVDGGQFGDRQRTGSSGGPRAPDPVTELPTPFQQYSFRGAGEGGSVPQYQYNGQEGPQVYGMDEGLRYAAAARAAAQNQRPVPGPSGSGMLPSSNLIPFGGITGGDSWQDILNLIKRQLQGVGF